MSLVKQQWQLGMQANFGSAGIGISETERGDRATGRASFYVSEPFYSLISQIYTPLFQCNNSTQSDLHHIKMSEGNFTGFSQCASCITSWKRGT